jgi:antitoxin (DNA-binding transcriptional repressor) of toxin-antitoxin stability system
MLTDVSEEGAATPTEPSPVPAPRQPGWAGRLEREVRIRELRNAGSVISELASTGAIGRVTSDGRLVGWLVPAAPSEQRAEELRAQGRLRPGRPGGLAGHRPLPRRADTAPLTRTLDQQRRSADR